MKHTRHWLFALPALATAKMTFAEAAPRCHRDPIYPRPRMMTHGDVVHGTTQFNFGRCVVLDPDVLSGAPAPPQ